MARPRAGMRRQRKAIDRPATSSTEFDRLSSLALVASTLISSESGTLSPDDTPNLDELVKKERFARATALATMTFPRSSASRHEMTLSASLNRYPESQRRYFLQASPEWIPRQVAAKSNATILLAGCSTVIPLNGILAEDNHVIESLLPPPVLAGGFKLGLPTLSLIKATLMALTAHLTDEELMREDAQMIVELRRGTSTFTSDKFKSLFPRDKRGTTKYRLEPKLLALFQHYKIAWPGLAISRDALKYLHQKYLARRALGQQTTHKLEFETGLEPLEATLHPSSR